MGNSRRGRSSIASRLFGFQIFDLKFEIRFHMISALDLRNKNSPGAQSGSQLSRPAPLRSRAAAVKIECRGAVLGICVAGEVRLGQGGEPGDAPRTGKRMPD